MRELAKLLLLATGIAAGCAGTVETGADDGEAALEPIPALPGDPANGATFAVDVSFWETPLAQSQMDCLWDSGVRHVVVGTQDEGIARQQLAMAVSRGMTVDAYVYLYWDRDAAAQVREAFRRVASLPIGRMWLDIEQDPAGRGAGTILGDVQVALDACRAQGTVPCGFYTSPGFWKYDAGNATAFTQVPLWYALYNDKTSLSGWSAEAFGGWSSPVAKQFATRPLCGIGGADWDTMQVSAAPAVTVDRSLPPDDGRPPAAPGGLYPSDGAVLTYDYAKIMSGTVPRATRYQLAVERWTGAAWIVYYTFTTPNAFVKLIPSVRNALYRFRARAQNSHGWGAWSDWAGFEYGRFSGTRPGATPSPASSPTPAPSPDGVPGSLAPDGAITVAGPAVTLSCSTVAGAGSYQFALEVNGGAGYQPYYTYTAGAPARTFYPTLHGAWRWRVRAIVGGVPGAWSSDATFQFP